MKLLKAKVKTIKEIKENVFLLSFISRTIAQNAKPGQFLHLKINNKTILRRPLSIHSVKNNEVRLLFRIRGRGTLGLSKYKPSDELNILGPLGNGFKLESRIQHQASRNILVAGGMGVAPLVFLAERLKKQSTEYRVQSTDETKTKDIIILGAKTKKDILAAGEFKKLGFKVLIATDDGSFGTKGTAVNILKNLLATRYSLLATSSIYACGPNTMLFSLAQLLKQYSDISCQVSFEQFMGCGVGICCGCTINTKQGYKKVCKDGPVFDIKEVY